MRFLTDALPGRLGHVFQRSHVVHSIGQLDEQDADVLGHRDQHLSKVLRLTLARGGEFDLGDLGEPFDDERHLFTEQPFDLFDGRERILDRIVQESGGDRDIVHPHLDEDARHLQRVNQVGLARETLLTFVDLGGEDVGSLQQREVTRRVVLHDAVGDIVESQHSPQNSFYRSSAWTKVPEGRPSVHYTRWGGAPPNRLRAAAGENLSARSPRDPARSARMISARFVTQISRSSLVTA